MILPKLAMLLSCQSPSNPGDGIARQGNQRRFLEILMMKPSSVTKYLSDISAAAALSLMITGCFTIASPAFAQAGPELISVTTSTAPQDCRSEHPLRRIPTDDGGVRRCPGPHGLFVYIAEVDLRQTVTVGRNRLNANSELAAKQTFGPFNSASTTVEWRSSKNRPPIAIIQRWYIADNDELDKNGRPQNKQLLVVTRLPPGGACHIAYIDVKANPNASELARKAADSARSFDCTKDKVQIDGISGRAVELALPARPAS
jgi:hypothetical protein